MDKKALPTHIWPARDPPLKKDLHRLKVKGWKQIFQANGQKKKKSRSSNTHIRQNRLQKKGP